MIKNRIKVLAFKYPLIKMLLSPAIKSKQTFQKIKFSPQKRIINNLAEFLIGDPIIRIDEFEGIFFVDVRSDLFSRYIIHKRYEPQLSRLSLKYLNKNKDVVDVGANVGFYTVMFAKNLKRGKVLAIEPTKNALNRLKKNIDLNGVAKMVELFEGVVSNIDCAVEIKTIEGREEYSSLGAMQHPSIVSDRIIFEKVKSTTLDDLVAEKFINPGFIKIDVEGAEHLVFEGAKSILVKSRPVILSELSDFLLKKNGSSSKDVIALIKSYEYDIFDAVDPYMEPGLKDFGNLLCFPKEMKIRSI